MPSARNSSMISALLALSTLLTGCPGRIDDPLAFREAAAARCPSSFDVERDLFARTCGSLGCHTGGPTIAAAGLDLSTAGIRDRLMTHVSVDCDDRPLIEVGNMEGSLLMQKVGESPPCGDRMPAGLPPLNPTEMACLTEYVASLTGDVGDGGMPPPPADAGAPTPYDAGAPTGPDAGPGPAPTEAVTFEAEAMTLDVYEVDAADATVIRLPDGSTTGTARATFDGAAGTYQLTVHAIAENDGTPTLTVRVAGTEVAAVTYPLTAAGLEPYAVGPYTVDLAPGDEILLEGFAESGAWARVDRVEVQP